MTQTDDLSTLQMVAHAQRFSWYWDKPNRFALNAVNARISRSIGLQGQIGRKIRMRVTSAIVGRPVTSSQELYAGECDAILREPNLDRIIQGILNDETT